MQGHRDKAGRHTRFSWPAWEAVRGGSGASMRWVPANDEPGTWLRDTWSGPLENHSKRYWCQTWPWLCVPNWGSSGPWAADPCGSSPGGLGSRAFVIIPAPQVTPLLIKAESLPLYCLYNPFSYLYSAHIDHHRAPLLMQSVKRNSWEELSYCIWCSIDKIELIWIEKLVVVEINHKHQDSSTSSTHFLHHVF